MPRQIGPPLQHILRRRPARPFRLAADGLDAGPHEAGTPDANAIAQRLAALFDEEEKFVRRIDDDRAGPLRPRIVDFMALINRIDATRQPARVRDGSRRRRRSISKRRHLMRGPRHGCREYVAGQEQFEKAAAIRTRDRCRGRHRIGNRLTCGVALGRIITLRGARIDAPDDHGLRRDRQRQAQAKGAEDARGDETLTYRNCCHCRCT